jgi:hypothetical protein
MPSSNTSYLPPSLLGGNLTLPLESLISRVSDLGNGVFSYFIKIWSIFFSIHGLLEPHRFGLLLDSIEDPTFCGLAVDCEEVSRAHGLEPIKCVTFEGTNTWRYFYMCFVLNVSLNHSPLIEASSR